MPEESYRHDMLAAAHCSMASTVSVSILDLFSLLSLLGAWISDAFADALLLLDCIISTASLSAE
jgi:hypothetical protein